MNSHRRTSRGGGRGAGGGGGAAVSEIFGQNAQNSGNKESIKDGIKKYINKACKNIKKST